MNIYLYDYYLPIREMNISDKIVRVRSIRKIENLLKSEKPSKFIIPVGVTDLVGLDFRNFFYSIGKSNHEFVLIGTRNQILFTLSKNMEFSKNSIKTIELPLKKEFLEWEINYLAL